MRYTEFKALISEVKRGAATLSPAYFVYGGDEYLIEDAVKLARSVLGEEFEEFNYFESSDIGSVSESFYTFPMFDDRRVCVYRADDPSDDDIAALKALLTSGVDYSTLIVCLGESLLKQLKIKSDECVTCSALTLEEITEEVRRALSAPPAVKIEDSAIKELADRTQNSMARIVSEVQKLRAYAPNGITLKDVKDMVTADLEYQTYMFADAVSNHSADSALKILDAILKSGTPPRVIIASLYDRYRRMLHISLNKDKSNDEMAKLLAMRNPGAIYYMRKTAANYTQVKLKNCVDSLHALQTDVVNGLRTEDSALNEAVLELLAM